MNGGNRGPNLVAVVTTQPELVRGNSVVFVVEDETMLHHCAAQLEIFLGARSYALYSTTILMVQQQSG